MLFLALVAMFVGRLDKLHLEVVVHIRVVVKSFDLLVFAMALAHDLDLVDKFSVSSLDLLMVETVMFFVCNLLLPFNGFLNSTTLTCRGDHFLLILQILVVVHC